jgi:hypothetical protein
MLESSGLNSRFPAAATGNVETGPGDYFFGLPGPIMNQMIRPTSGNIATTTIQMIFFVVSALLLKICTAA